MKGMRKGEEKLLTEKKDSFWAGALLTQFLCIVEGGGLCVGLYGLRHGHHDMTQPLCEIINDKDYP